VLASVTLGYVLPRSLESQQAQQDQQTSHSQAPVAPAVPVTDTYFGTKVVDPYRWMEAPNDSAFLRWQKGQAEHARAVVEAMPMHAEFMKGAMRWLDADAVAFGVQITPAAAFYLKVEPGSNEPGIYTRSRSGGRLGSAERVLVDPGRMSVDGQRFSVTYTEPSPDARYVAYGLAEGGSEDAVLHVVETATRRVLPDSITRARFGSPQWRSDGRSFYYSRFPEVPSDAPPATRFTNLRVYLHVLGTNPDSDRVVFGPGVNPGVQIDEHSFTSVHTQAESPYVLGEVEDGVSTGALAYYVATAPAPRTGAPDWRKFADASDSVRAVAMHGRDLYFISGKGASHYSVLRIRLDAPDVSQATVVLPPSEAVIMDIAAARDALYVLLLDGGASRVVRMPYDGSKARDTPLSYPGTIYTLAAHAEVDGVVFSTASWVHSDEIASYDPATDRVTNTGIQAPSKFDASGLVAEEAKVRATDGTMIPLSIVHKRGITLDGSHPTLVAGYGAYGISILASFTGGDPWLERGGVFAVAHVRGGGEYGEDWHRAGMKGTKMNTVTDFIACTQYLIDKGYTSSEHLAGTGASAGGILIGGAITMRPDLFAAAVINVGVTNALRFEETQGGPANVAEFGSTRDSVGFMNLYAMDAYQHVRDGTRYPAVLLTTGSNDPRVAPWMVGKMAARLQAATTSGKPVLMLVDYDAGHGGGDKVQIARTLADKYAFLASQLGMRGDGADMRPKR
jgi:prolyl oligopeptidase